MRGQAAGHAGFRQFHERSAAPPLAYTRASLRTGALFGCGQQPSTSAYSGRGATTIVPLAIDEKDAFI
jgi:hypothetical protein